MKTQALTRPSSLAGLLLLFALVAVALLALAQTARAGSNYPSYGGNAGSASGMVAQVARLQPGHTNDVLGSGAVTRGRGEAAFRPVAAAPYVVAQSAPSRYSLSESGPGSGTAAAGFSPAPGGPSSTSVWIAIAGLVGGLLIVGWALLRNRIRRREPSFDCSATLLGC